MDKNQALRRLRRLLGPKASYRENPGALAGEQRLRAIDARKLARATQEAAHAELEARQKALLAGDAEYQRLLAAYKAARFSAEKARDAAFGRRITVGVDKGLFFVVEAEADNWAEAVELVEAKRKVAA